MAYQDINTREEPNDWLARAQSVFGGPKPTRFVTCSCLECRDHQQTLSAAEVDTVTISDLGHSALDPLAFATPAGMRYYFPALVRLTLQHAEEKILEALLSVVSDRRTGATQFWESSTTDQRKFVANFLNYIIETHADEIDMAGVADEVLCAYEWWSQNSGDESVQ